MRTSIPAVLILICLSSPVLAGETILTRGPSSLYMPAIGQGGIGFSAVFLNPDVDTSYSTPYQLVGFKVEYDCEAPFSSLQIHLDDSGSLFGFSPLQSSPLATSVLMYDANYMVPENDESISLPQAWRDDLADGTWSAHVWVNDVLASGLAYGTLKATAYYLVPEPTSLCLLTLAASALWRRKR